MAAIAVDSWSTMIAEQASEATADPDWELLVAAGRGDDDAFAVLVERHRERIAALCHRFLEDRDEALDAAQEVFLKAWREARRFEPRARVSTWLHRIAVNLCLNRLRRRAVLRFVPFVGTGDDGEERSFDPVDPLADPEAELTHRRALGEVRKAIRALPASQRAVLVLVRFEGMSYRDAAETLGITEGAVESRLVRAMRRLSAARQRATEAA